MDATRGGPDVDTPKLKNRELREHREGLIEEQEGVCPLCGLELLTADAVLDHDHETGHIRRALHRSCNSAEGKILQWAGRRSKGDCPVEFIQNLAEYWVEDYTNNPLHPTHGKPKPKRKKK